MTPGTALPERTMSDIDIERIRGVMDLMGDSNRVHDDDAFAKSVGLRGAVNQGPANLAYVMNMLLAWGGPGTWLERLDFRLDGIVTLGDEVTAGGVLTAVEDRGSWRRATCDVWLDRDDGARVVVATALVRVPV